jgi:hypothetical protein
VVVMTIAEQHTTITTNITSALDEITQSLADVPGRYPQDAQIASTLLLLAAAQIQAHSGPCTLLLNTLERRGANRAEAREVAQAVEALALRLGAWLGRER